MHAASPVLAALLFVTTAGVPATAGTLSLDGTWDVIRSKSGEMPGADAQWTPVEVPSFLSIAREQPFAWYRRAVTVPNEMAGRHVFLRFGGVKYVSEVYLNGRRLGGHYGGWEPFEVDITGAYRTDGPNELLVRVQDCTGLIDQEFDYDKQGPGVRLIEQAKDTIMAPIGSQYSTLGIWEPVTLVARGDVYAESVFVRTSVRKKRIEVDVTVRNLSEKARKVMLNGSLAEGSDRAPEGGLGWNAKLEVPAGGSATHTFRREWKNPRLWCPEDPHLYQLVTTVAEHLPTVVLPDFVAITTRFGFREFWTDGPKFVLNGVPMNFLATAGHPRGQPGGELSKASAIDFYRRIRETGCVAMRLHANVWPKHWYDAADEVGMPLIMESAFFCWARSYALTRPKFWENYHDHLRAIIRDHYNHPSIVMTSLENEILHCGGNRVPGTIARLAEAGRLVKRLDPTRPIMYDGDGDPEGVADVVNLHYPLNFDKENLWPECAWWLEKGMVVNGWPREFFKWDRKKPLYFGEFLHLQHYRQPDNYTTLLGDRAYEGFNQAMAECKARAWLMQIQAYRGCGVSGMCPWTLTETGEFPSAENPRYRAVLIGYDKDRVFVREGGGRFFSGQEVRRTTYVYNDSREVLDVTVTPAFVGRDGTRKALKKRQFRLPPSENVRFGIDVRMPEVDKRVDIALAVSMMNDDWAKPQIDYWPCSVFPQSPMTLADNIDIAVYGKCDEALLGLLQRSGARVSAIESLAETRDADVWLFAPDSLSDLAEAGSVPIAGDESGLRGRIGAFVRGGGTVIVLEQSGYQNSPFPVTLVERGCTIAFCRAADSALFRNVDKSLDFLTWAGDHVVARKTIRKPTSGPWRTLVDSGGPEGLVYCPLVELRDGLGRYFFNQLLIGEKLDTEPIARLMLENMLNAAAKKNPAPVKLAVVQEKLPLADAVNEVGAPFTDLSGKLAEADLKPFGVILAEADAAEVAENRKKLRGFVEAGGRVTLHAGTPRGLAGLQELFPEMISAQRSSSLPVTIRKADPVISGLSNQQLHWYGSREGMSWRQRTPLSPAVCDYSIVAGRPAAEKIVTLQAEAMAIGRGTPRKSKEDVFLGSTASLETNVEFAQPGEYTFALRGRGTPVAGIYPEITFLIDGRRAGCVTTEGKQWGTYCMTADVSEPGSHRLAVAFTNDSYAPEKNEDRNVWVDWISFGPTPPLKSRRILQPAALVKVPLGKGFYLLDQIRWDRPEGNGEKASRYLSCLLNNLNCEFASPVDVLSLPGGELKREKGVNRYVVRDGVAYVGSNGIVSTTIRFAKTRRYEVAIVADGTEAGGEFPKMEILLDGRKIGALSITRPGRQTLRLEADVPEGEHRLGIEFVNDFYDPPEDRNLRIHAVEVR